VKLLTLRLDDIMVTLNLNSTDDSILTVEPDEKTAKDATRNLVSELNSFLDFLENNTYNIKDEVLSSVNSLIDDHKKELESNGITLGDDGRLELHDSKSETVVS
jgi:hypothetical protein